MRLIAGEQAIYEGILKNGTKKSWLSDYPIEIKIGRPEGVELTLNGYPLGKPGDGQAKHIRLSRNGMEML